MALECYIQRVANKGNKVVWDNTEPLRAGLHLRLRLAVEPERVDEPGDGRVLEWHPCVELTLLAIHAATAPSPPLVHPDDLVDWENEIRHTHDNIILQALLAAGRQPCYECLLLLCFQPGQAVCLIHDRLRPLPEIAAHLHPSLPHHFGEYLLQALRLRPT
ncbi:hypothetical protein FOMPIDRAFT_1024419 [Fomitopsis schrenkii]|uniref:Uncharacterized protein n=1 Tax=Fomitopsis schrenkii TaxID=2126942 RepID=S8E2N5_FOMSC|nr:hypothetical protein FOMPIDRAFT_1024419 [Fomitopsis schrenkii]